MDENTAASVALSPSATEMDCCRVGGGREGRRAGGSSPIGGGWRGTWLCTREGEEWGLLKLLLLLTLLVLLLVREMWGKTGGRPGGEVEVEEEEGGFSLLAEEKVNEMEGMMPMEACALSGRGSAMLLLLLLLLLLAAPNAKLCVGIDGGSGGQKGGGWEGKWRREAPRSFSLAHSCLRRSY